MMMPPMSCRSMENCGSRNTMNASAPNFTTSEAILLTCASSAGVAAGLMYSR
jgi:hypothetical protein